MIRTAEGEFQVEDVIKLLGGKIGHVGRVTKGMVKVGDTAELLVDEETRALSANNHSATHLLHKALRMVLGSHVEQAGSSVNADRLRFDFTHFSALTAEELQKVEDIVNEQIRKHLDVKVENMPIEEAKKTGAAALFGEKYGDIVRVVSMGDFSVEFCGGTHVANTGDISAFKILSETGVAAGVRRIEALTAKGLSVYYKELEEKLLKASKLLKTNPDKLEEKIQHLQNENKALRSEVESLKSKLAKDAAGDSDGSGNRGFWREASGSQDRRRGYERASGTGRSAERKLGEGVVVLASAMGGKVSLMAMATEDAVKKGAHAGNLIKAVASLVGGGGGGRPNMAQAGGKNPEGIDDAVAKVPEVLKEQLK